MTKALIVFASLTGNTEEIADILAGELEERGLEVDVKECSNVTADAFQEYDVCVVATYTYGEGELPDEIYDFYEELADEDLSGKVYGTLGSGDTFYEFFCQAVKNFDAQFEKTGATKGAENVYVDLDPQAEDIENIQNFARSLVEKVS